MHGATVERKEKKSFFNTTVQEKLEMLKTSGTSCVDHVRP